MYTKSKQMCNEYTVNRNKNVNKICTNKITTSEKASKLEFLGTVLQLNARGVWLLNFICFRPIKRNCSSNFDHKRRIRQNECKTISIRRVAVRETGVYRHNIAQ